MIVDEEVVTNIAELAQLQILDEDMQEFIDSLNNVLALVEQMQGVDTEGVVPMSNPLDGVQRLRADKVTETNNRAEYQQIAPEIEGGLYLVPRVIE